MKFGPPYSKCRSVPTTFALTLLPLVLAGCAAARHPAKLADIQSRPIPETPEAVSQELEVMVEIDQKMRFAMMAAPDGNPPLDLVQKLRAIDHANTERMKLIVDHFGWPTISKFGTKAAHRAWLLVQHADAQPDFQRHCLELMKPLLEKGEVRKDNYAYLTDRVLLAEGNPQIYGTQFHTVDGVFQPQPMIDPDNVDQRRREMGMVTLEQYKTWFKK